MVTLEYKTGDIGEIKKFVSNILKEIFNSPAKGLEDLDNIDKNFIKFWVEKQNGKLIGTIGLKKERERFRIARIYVDKAFRDEGIGTKLMNKLLKYCRQNKITDFFLTTYKQMNSIGFYEKMGFRIIKEEGNIITMRYSVIIK